MTHTYNTKNKQVSPLEESVISYLCENPDFFIRNSSLLNEIMIPHFFEGNISSLIEKQVKLLRKENNELKNNLEASEKKAVLISHSRREIFRSFLEFLTVDKVIEYDRLMCSFFDRYFETSYIKLFIFDYGVEDKKGNIYFKRNDSKLRFMFTEIFTRNKPLCSSLQTEQLQILFNNDSEKIKSNLLIPIKYNSLDCLFALGSNKRNQYSIGDELNLLVFISELLVFKLKDLLN